jgi:hypothetical protein
MYPEALKGISALIAAIRRERAKRGDLIRRNSRKGSPDEEEHSGLR